MELIVNNKLIESILNIYKPYLADDFDQYRSHVYRVFNFAIPFVKTDQDIETLAIAAAFHDLGIWTNKTFDYLQHSIELAILYAEANELSGETILEIETIINEHHKLSEVKSSALAEVFRQADLVDLSLGFIRCKRKASDIRLIQNAFPNNGFHRNLTKLFFNNLLKNPFKPLPMYKW
ncbi:MAG: HD domain-containing protein [Bacteroidales bacterium]